jgi:protein tyrosine/serine phosphatase
VPVEAVHTSLFGAHDPEYEAASTASWRAAATDEDAYAGGYLAHLDARGAQIAGALAAVADAPAVGAVLVHCWGGKDRTGIVCALALRLAGVDRGSIADDYALSGPNLAGDTAWVDEASDEDERAGRARSLLSPRAAMLRVLEELERRHGSVEEYLLAAGLDEERIARLRDRLR